MNSQTGKLKIDKLLIQPQIGKEYLLKALNSGSETIFLEALHNVIDAIFSDLCSDSAQP